MSLNPKRRKDFKNFSSDETISVTSILPDLHAGFCQVNQSSEILYKVNGLWLPNRWRGLFLNLAP